MFVPKEKDSIKAKVLQPDSTVCYLLRSRSFSDLLVLDHHCKKEGLPRPIFHKKSAYQKAGTAFYVYFKKLGFLSTKPEKGIPQPLVWASEEIAKSPKGPDIRLVPVSVYWGRQPGKEDASLLKLLFFNDEHGGLWQRLFAILFHGREVVCSLGEPISTKEALNKYKSSDRASRRLHRIVKVHFRRDRQKVVGPQVYDLSQVMEDVIRTPAVRKAIADTARKKKAKPEKYEAKARRYFREISAKQSHATIRLWARFLKWVWQKVYDGVEVRNLEHIQEIPGNHEMVFLPCHRSHIDYLLLAYILFGNGFRTPHTAAGVNLNFWPAGPLLRRGGAFYLRRSFRGNRVYGEVFHEYVCYLIDKGFPMQLFIEGGRSRTGKLLKPKTGMLSMIVEGQRRTPQKKVILIPTYIGYDRVIEANSYQRELGGKKKAGESLKQLLGAVKILRKKHGKTYLTFGEPLDLHTYLDKNGIFNKSEDSHSGSDRKPAQFVATVNSLAVDVMEEVNKNTAIPESAIFSSLLLSSPNNALTEYQLLHLTTLVQRIILGMGKQDVQVKTEVQLKKDLARIQKLLQWQRFSNPAGDVVYARQSTVFHLTYYRNNIAHFLLFPGAFAQLLHLQGKVDRAVAKSVLELLYQVHKNDLFLPKTEGYLDTVFDKLDAVFLQEALFSESDNLLKQPDVGNEQYFDLKMVSRLAEPYVEPVAMLIYFLGAFAGKTIVKSSFVSCFQAFRQRMLILTGGDNVTAFYQDTVALLQPYLFREKLIEAIDDPPSWKVLDLAKERADKAAYLLNGEMRASLIEMVDKVETKGGSAAVEKLEK